jgi:hypothetical protein
MKKSKAKMWCGILSPLWFVLGSPLWFVTGLLASYSSHSYDSMFTDYFNVSDYFAVFGLGLYFGIGLLLSVSGVRSGYLSGKLLGFSTIMFFILLLVAAFVVKQNFASE